MIFPELLPWSLRRRLDQLSIDRSVRKILSTPATAAANALSADFEVHLLLRSEDFLVGMVALKSLLRFNLAAAVTVTDDGSLSGRQRQLLTRHIPGVRILDRYAITKTPSLLSEYPNLDALYRSNFHMIAKLLHPILLGRCDKMVAIDSDTAFLKFPQTIVDWARAGQEDGLYLHDSQERNEEASWLKEVFAAVNRQLPEDFTFKIRHRFFNAGMLCYQRKQCHIDHAERFLQWRKTNASKFTQDNAAIWLGEWTQEQTAYMSIFEGMKGEVIGLGEEYKIGCGPWQTFHHFLRAGLITKGAQQELRELVDEICKAV